MHEKDPNHWLYRFDAREWLRTAEGELVRAKQALIAKQYRAGVTQARRAAGMAWNAVLFVTGDESGYGRSYMEHLQGLARDQTVPEPVRQAARALVEAPVVQAVVTIGKGDPSLALAAEAILTAARERVSPTALA